MSSAICCILPQSPERVAEQSSDRGRTATLVEFMKPICLCRASNRKVQDEKQYHYHLSANKNVKTLEDWMLASPCVYGTTGNAEDAGASRQNSSSRVHPSVVADNEHLNSFKTREREVENASSVIGRSQRGRMKKKVSFRLPEVAEVIVFEE
ncbi:hypothetical protein NMG60_11037326 [Bertholletia excelsa]